MLDLDGMDDLCADPAPLERVRRAFAGLEPGQRLEVRTPVAEHAFAVRAWSRRSGVHLVEDASSDGVTRLVVERGA